VTTIRMPPAVAPKTLGAALPAFAILLALTCTPCGADEGRSLFDEQTYHPLGAEFKALRVGDVLTVVVQESATASSTTDLHGQRSFNVAAQAGNAQPLSHSAAVGTSSNSDGTGTTERTGKLLAQVSVRVTQVEPNGDLTVSGQQSLKINGEQQLITLTGVVRTRDIGADNTVLSSRIAAAHIRFEGKGFVSDQSKPGWLARFFGFLGM
jgi:flagellar L-ring protein precursor FlgH